MHRQDY